MNEQLHGDRDRWLAWVRQKIQAQVLQFPYGAANRLASPDGRFVLYGEPYRAGVKNGPELWFEDTATSARKRLLLLGGTVRAEWSPDSTAFSVSDRRASDSTLAYIYDSATLGRVAVHDAIVRSDPNAAAFAEGHAYFDVERWDGPAAVVVRLHGHTDRSPVRCFDLRYLVTRGGKINRLSKRIRTPAAHGCGE